MNRSSLDSKKYKGISLSCALTFFFILTLTVTNAQKSYHYTYTLQDAETGMNISSVTIQIKEMNLDTGKNVTITEYIATNELSLDLLEGNYEFEFVMDDVKTDGKDYYATEKIIAKSNQEQMLYAFPLASLRGKIVDDLNNLMGGADVVLECDRDIPPIQPVKTDKLGAFTFPLVPTGNCIITASDKDQDSVDQQHLAFNRGDFETLSLKLEANSSEQSLILLTIITIIIISASVLFFFVRYRHRASVPAPIQQKEQKKAPITQVKKPVSKAETILPTLRDREQSIVQFLLDNKGISTQAKIKHATKIPKTSLMRILDTLQSKKIIEIDTTHEVKTIKLTAWFMRK